MSDVRPRGRSKSEEKREQILAASADLFLSQGFDAISMDLVAEQAGVSKQTVYSHFGSKNDLFEAAISARCAEFKFADILQDTQRPVGELLRELAGQFSKLLTSEDSIRIFRLCAGAATVQNPELSKLFYRSGPEVLMNLLADYFAQQVTMGRLQLANPHVAAKQFLFMVKSELHFKTVLGLDSTQAQAELDDYLDSCIKLFLKGYGVDNA